MHYFYYYYYYQGEVKSNYKKMYVKEIKTNK